MAHWTTKLVNMNSTVQFRILSSIYSTKVLEFFQLAANAKYRSTLFFLETENCLVQIKEKEMD